MSEIDLPAIVLLLWHVRVAFTNKKRGVPLILVNYLIKFVTLRVWITIFVCPPFTVQQHCIRLRLSHFFENRPWKKKKFQKKKNSRLNKVNLNFILLWWDGTLNNRRSNIFFSSLWKNEKRGTFWECFLIFKKVATFFFPPPCVWVILLILPILWKQATIRELMNAVRA